MLGWTPITVKAWVEFWRYSFWINNGRIYALPKVFNEFLQSLQSDSRRLITIHRPRPLLCNIKSRIPLHYPHTQSTINKYSSLYNTVKCNVHSCKVLVLEKEELWHNILWTRHFDKSTFGIQGSLSAVVYNWTLWISVSVMEVISL